jgi:hypothetical protein
MATTTKRKKSTAIRRFLAMRAKTAGDEAASALAALSNGVKHTPHGSIEWCEHALVLASQRDMLGAAQYRIDHANGKPESQCIIDSIAWIRDTLALHAEGGRSTSMFANAVKEAQMRGYVHALRDLEFVLEQGEGE